MANQISNDSSRSQAQKSHNAVNAGVDAEDSDRLSKEPISKENTRSSRKSAGAKSESSSGQGSGGLWNPTWWKADHDKLWESASPELMSDWQESQRPFRKLSNEDEVEQEARRDNSEQEIEARSSAVSLADENEGRGIGQTSNPRVNEVQSRDASSAESGIRYGYMAREQYRDESDWGSGLESKLQREWESSGQKIPWAQARESVKFGYQYKR